MPRPLNAIVTGQVRSREPSGFPDSSDSDDASEDEFNREPPEPEDWPDPGEDPGAEPDGIDLSAWEEEARSVRPRIAQPEPQEEQRKKVREVFDRLEAKPGEPDEAEIEALLKELDVIPGEIPNADDFVAGNFAHNRAAWEEMLQERPTRAGRRVLDWLRRGFRPSFGDPARAKADKKKVVDEMLRKAYPGVQPEVFLTGNRPHRVAFKNHRSFYRHWSFSSKELLKLLLWGAIEIADPGSETEVTVENPLGVADQDGKLRLFLNGRYVNIFLKELPFEYQKLRDVLLFLEKGSYMSTWDLKSGYYNVFLHPDFRKYMGFRVGNLVFRYTVPAFGLSQACFLFTKLMNEPAKALRLRGVPVSDYIDDGFSGARTFAVSSKSSPQSDSWEAWGLTWACRSVTSGRSRSANGSVS